MGRGFWWLFSLFAVGDVRGDFRRAVHGGFVFGVGCGVGAIYSGTIRAGHRQSMIVSHRAAVRTAPFTPISAILSMAPSKPKSGAASSVNAVMRREYSYDSTWSCWTWGTSRLGAAWQRVWRVQIIPRFRFRAEWIGVGAETAGR